MRILFTGGSSFTGMWFVKELLQAGHKIVASYLHPYNHYSGIRLERVNALKSSSEQAFNLPFGSAPFLNMIREKGPFDLLCHHAADVTDYKSPEFDVLEALNKNTYNLKSVLHLLKEGDCEKVILTGSLFAQQHGEGAMSSYGLSKGLTTDYFRHFCKECEIAFSEFVIPNPFGPFEEPRFTTSLVRAWSQGETGQVLHPKFVRDNIHVSLLAKVYAQFAELKLNSLAPSGYVETQEKFAIRFASEMETRLKIPCRLSFAQQSPSKEPLVRTNRDLVDANTYGWNEAAAWDELANYYKKHTLKT